MSQEPTTDFRHNLFDTPQTSRGVKSMTPNEYQQLAARTECNQSNSLANMSHGLACNGEGLSKVRQQDLLSIRLNHSIIGLSGEVGELASLLQKWIYYNKQFTPEELTLKLSEEYGDALWYVAEGLNALGVSMEDVMQRNIEKLKIRYPDKYTDWHAAHENRKLKEEESALRIHEPTPMDYEMEDAGTPSPEGK
jgi:NTP pyrophosphatase (non-canonical NTP hydrolase)